MSRFYKFIYEDLENGGATNVSFVTDDDTWGDPLQYFMQFLRGCGYVFDMEAELGVVETAPCGNVRVRTANDIHQL